MYPPRSTDVQMIGRAPVYFQTPRYVEIDLPFRRYRIDTPYGGWEVNVSNIFIKIYGEDIAVKMTAWGDVREKHSKFVKQVCARFGRHETRLAFINSVSFELIF